MYNLRSLTFLWWLSYGLRIGHELEKHLLLIKKPNKKKTKQWPQHFLVFPIKDAADQGYYYTTPKC